jgi:hypothetical protein
MIRYKGRASFKAIERDFPHIVEMAVPEGGLGKQLDAMYDWHRTRGIPAHGRGRREEGRDYIRWCFADPCVYRKPKPAHNGDEARQGSHVNL